MPLAPVEIALGGDVVGRDQLGGLLEEALGGEHLGDGPARDVARRDAQHLRCQRAFGVGLEFDENLAGLVVRGRREIDARDDVGERPCADIGGDKPAADGAGGEPARDRGHDLFQILCGKARAAVVEGSPQPEQLLGAQAQLRSPLRVNAGEKRHLIARQPRHRDFDTGAEAQLLRQLRQRRKAGDESFDMRSIDL